MNVNWSFNKCKLLVFKIVGRWFSFLFAQQGLHAVLMLVAMSLFNEMTSLNSQNAKYWAGKLKAKETQGIYSTAESFCNLGSRLKPQQFQQRNFIILSANSIFLDELIFKWGPLTLSSNVKNSWISKVTLVIINLPSEGSKGGFTFIFVIILLLWN